MTTPDTTLRTALTKLADDWPGGFGETLRALLAAHPAPETARSGHDIACDADYLDASCICDELTPAPVSDARRDDVGAAGPDSASGRGVQVPDYYGDGHLEVHATPGRAYADLTINTYGHWSIDITVDQLVDAIEKAGGPHLAVLPVPPVVDEAEVRERIAQDIDDKTPDGRKSQAFCAGMDRAARIARGATR